jgi:hypothetical protein
MFPLKTLPYDPLPLIAARGVGLGSIQIPTFAYAWAVRLARSLKNAPTSAPIAADASSHKRKVQYEPPEATTVVS